MLTFLLQDARDDRWGFDQRSHQDGSEAAARWVAHLLQEAASSPLPCPRCGREASVAANLDHLLGDHGASYAEAALWLEEADGDLFALAVHYLVTKARTGRSGPGRRGAADPPSGVSDRAGAGPAGPLAVPDRGR